MTMVAIIDYGMGNVGSVKNALTFLGVDSVISHTRADLESASHLILPGVGAFGDGMRKLKALNLIPILEHEVLKKKKPFLGICLGMQLLAEEGEEGGLTRGLGWIPGRVRRFRVAEGTFRVPHVGWNDIHLSGAAPLFDTISPQIFYFVHSYFLAPRDSVAVIATCEYGETFAAAVSKDTVAGVQFHPEKSQRAGLTLLRNFLHRH